MSHPRNGRPPDLFPAARGTRSTGLDPQLHPAVAGPLDDLAARAENVVLASTDPAVDSRTLADELFVHGLMSHLSRDVDAERARRVRSVMAALPARPLRLSDGRIVASSSAVSWAAAAMLLLAVGALSLFTARSEPSAAAMVRESLAAADSAGDRSYRVTTTLPEGVSFAPPPARLDVRDRASQLLTATAPDGGRFVVGRDAQGAWAIRPDGVVQRFGERQPGPRWIDLGQSLFLAESIDDVMTTLPANFSLSADVAAPLPASQTEGAASSAALLRRITAVRVDRGGPEPRRIELWIDPSTRLVERMELHWDDAERCGPRRHERSERWGGRGERPDRPPGSLADPRSDRSSGLRLAPPRDEPAGLDFPRGPWGPGRPPAPLAPRPEHGQPDAAEGLPPPLLAAPDPRRPARGFLDRPPDFRGREHPPAPRSIVFERIEAAAFPDDWFSPERHLADGGLR